MEGGGVLCWRYFFFFVCQSLACLLVRCLYFIVKCVKTFQVRSLYFYSQIYDNIYFYLPYLYFAVIFSFIRPWMCDEGAGVMELGAAKCDLSWLILYYFNRYNS